MTSILYYLNALFEQKVEDVIDNIEDLYNTGCYFMKSTITSKQLENINI